MKLFIEYTAAIEKMNQYYKDHKEFLFIIDFKKSLAYCEKIEDIPSEIIKFSFNLSNSEPKINKSIDFDVIPISFENYKAKFSRIYDHIAAGNSYLCNLTQPSLIKTNLSLEDIYQYSIAKHKLYIKDSIVVFSPETFVTIHGHEIVTYPIKGTIRVDLDPNGQRLLNDPKENAEHNTIVDLMRNDISMVATNVQLKAFKKIQKIQTHRGAIWQMSSEIHGTLKSEYIDEIGKLFDLILPAGSISGAPKEKTLEIINEIEGYPRGFYTGVFGYFDGTKITSSVMIRYIEKKKDGLFYKSGGGITYHSDVLQEYNELIEKIYVPIF